MSELKLKSSPKKSVILGSESTKKSVEKMTAKEQPSSEPNHLVQPQNNEQTKCFGVPKKNRKRKAIKKTISGSSNWALLCSELKTNHLVRKTDPVNIPEEKDKEDEEPAPKVPKQEVWFDNVDEMLIEKPEDQTTQTSGASKSLVKDQSFMGKTKCIGMDCEMVGTGKDGEESVLARVSLVNIYGNCLYDKYVLPREKVTDYRTAVSGVTKEILDEKAEPFLNVQKEVSDIIQGGILVGHALNNDLKVLFLGHPHKNIRDTSIYKPFRELFKGQKPSLKRLTNKLLGVKVQDGEHSSVEDAQAAMRLYTMHKKKWEMELKSLGRMKKKKKAKMKKKETNEENN